VLLPSTMRCPDGSRDMPCRIGGEIFADPHSRNASRPNVPVDVLVALEILKSGFEWSDQDLHEQLCFNLQVCYAVGIEDLGEEVSELWVLCNFRRRVREHAEGTGEDLFGRASSSLRKKSIFGVPPSFFAAPRFTDFPPCCVVYPCSCVC